MIIIFVAVIWHLTKQGGRPTKIIDYLIPVIASTRHHSKSTHFRHTLLSEEKMKS